MENSYVGKTIYICTKLFNYNDKIQAEYLETALKNKLNCDIFMPFRDTDENNLIGLNRTKIIYDSDIERLNSGKVILLVALYDGICKDEGISFEIGYAYGKGIPIFIINTDFIWYAIGEKEFLFDPIVSTMCSGYFHQYAISENSSFYEALISSQKRAFELAAEKIAELLTKKTIPSCVFCEDLSNHKVFIDFGGLRYEYQREYVEWLTKRLQAIGLIVKFSN